MRRHGAGYVIPVEETVRQHLDVAVEDDTHDFRVPVDDRAARVAADDVGGRHEVERRREVQRVAPLTPERGQAPRLLVVERGRPVVQPVERRLVGRDGAVQRVALHHAVGEPQGERGVGRQGHSIYLEQGFGQPLLLRRLQRVELIEPRLQPARPVVDRAHEDDRRVVRRLDRRQPAFEQRPALPDVGQLSPVVQRPGRRVRRPARQPRPNEGVVGPQRLTRSPETQDQQAPLIIGVERAGGADAPLNRRDLLRAVGPLRLGPGQLGRQAHDVTRPREELEVRE